MRVERFVEIEAPVEQVFEAFGDFESVPRWMSNVRDVRRTGRRTSRWTADASSSDAPFEWDVETTLYEPDHRIVWRSIGGDVDTDGEMVLQETPHNTTLMRLVISYYPTGGQNGPAVARFFGRNAEQQLEEDLERLKRDIERRAAATARSRSRDYGERASRQARRPEEDAPRRPVRPRDERQTREIRYPGRGAQADAGYNRQGREGARDEGRRESRLRDDYAPSDYRVRDDDERKRRFEEALRDARRSQLESMRRYDDERERARRRRVDDERFREAPRAETRPRRHMPEHNDVRRDEERERRPRSYDPTPREREREMPERRTDREAPDRMLRRGVDRLLDDDAPSSRWRRRD